MKRRKPPNQNDQFRAYGVCTGPFNVVTFVAKRSISFKAPINMGRFFASSTMYGLIPIHLIRSYIGQSHFPSFGIFTFVIPLFPRCKIQMEILIRSFETSVFSFVNLHSWPGNYRWIRLRTNATKASYSFWSTDSREEAEGKDLQPVSSTTGKLCVHVSQSGPINYFCHSTSVFHRPHDREIYYEIVADSNKLQETVRKL